MQTEEQKLREFVRETLRENPEDLNELFGLGRKPHQRLRLVQRVSSSVVRAEPGHLVVVLTVQLLSDRDGDGIPDISDVEPDVHQHLSRVYPRFSVRDIKPDTWGSRDPDHMYLRATLT